MNEMPKVTPPAPDAIELAAFTSFSEGYETLSAEELADKWNRTPEGVRANYRKWVGALAAALAAAGAPAGGHQGRSA